MVTLLPDCKPKVTAERVLDQDWRNGQPEYGPRDCASELQGMGSVIRAGG